MTIQLVIFRAFFPPLYRKSEKKIRKSTNKKSGLSVVILNRDMIVMKYWVDEFLN